MWLDKKNESTLNICPLKYKKYMETFKDHNPEFIFIFWDMKKVIDLFDNPNYIEIKKYKEMWYNFKHHIQRCDFARYIIIYLFGGLYIDLDFRCFKNLSPLLLNRELLFVYEPTEHNYGNENKIANGFIGSIKNNNFWIELMDHIQDLPDKSNAMETTGPIRFSLFINANEKYKNVKNFVSTCDLIPLNDKLMLANGCGNISENNININTYYLKLNNYTDTLWNEGSKWWLDDISFEHKEDKMYVVPENESFNDITKYYKSKNNCRFV